MKIDRNLWNKALLLEQEFIRRGEQLSRKKLSDALQINDNTAKLLLFALENRDIIRLQPVSFDITEPYQTELLIADLHIPFQDDLAVQSVLDYADRLQPDIITILGDLLDFYKISVFVKNPTRKSVKEEIKETRQFLEDLRHRFPKARIIYAQGNHEERWQRYIMKNANEIYDLVDDLLETKLNLKGLNIEYITQPFRIGKLWHLHGHERSGGSYAPEYITNVMWKYIHDHFIVGHFHRAQDKTFKRIDGKNYWGGAVGYLAKELDYARLNNWTQGFAVIRYNQDGSFKAELRRIVDGEIY